MKVLVGFILSILLCFSATAQPEKSPPKTLVNYGVSGLYIYEITVIPVEYVSSGESYLAPFFSIWNTSYSFRRSLVNFNDHKSFGVMASPSLALINDGFNLFDFKAEIPITVGFNWGAAATHKSVSTKGFGWHFGVNVLKAPLLNSITGSIMGADDIRTDPQLMFCTSLHFRNWSTRYNDDGECREIELFFAMGPPADGLEFPDLEGFSWNIPTRISIHFRRFLNY